MTKFNILIEQDKEGYFISEVVELPGCHTQANNIKKTRGHPSLKVGVYKAPCFLDEGNFNEISCPENLAIFSDPKLKTVKLRQHSKECGFKFMDIIEKSGFKFIRQEGSHMLFWHNDGRTTIIPNHPGEEIGIGLLTKIIKKDLMLSREEFEKIL